MPNQTRHGPRGGPWTRLLPSGPCRVWLGIDPDENGEQGGPQPHAPEPEAPFEPQEYGEDQHDNDRFTHWLRPQAVERTQPNALWRPNGSRLSCGRLARRRKGVGRSPCPARGTTLRFL